jgi:hypothetical protein
VGPPAGYGMGFAPIAGIRTVEWLQHPGVGLESKSDFDLMEKVPNIQNIAYITENG